MLKIQTDKILQKEMDRKAFLKNTGIVFAGLIGVTAVVKQLNLLGESVPATRESSSAFAYGGSNYSGSQRSFSR